MVVRRLGSVSLTLAAIACGETESDARKASPDAGGIEDASLDVVAKIDAGAAPDVVVVDVIEDVQDAPVLVTPELLGQFENVTMLRVAPAGVFLEELSTAASGFVERRIVRVDPDTGGVSLVAELGGSLADMVIDGETVIWAEGTSACVECGGNSWIRSAPAGGGVVTDLATVSASVFHIALVPGSLFFVRGFQLVKLDLASKQLSDVTPTPMPIQPIVAGDITASSERVYFSLDFKLTAHDITSNQLVPLAVGLYDAPRMFFRDGLLYFTTSEFDSIERVSAEGGSVETVVSNLDPIDFAVGTELFWAEGGDCGVGRIWRAELSGEGSAPWIDACDPALLAADDTHLYFVSTKVASALYRAPIDAP